VRRALSDEEVSALLRVAVARRVVYLVALTTGLRRSELNALQWGDVHLDAVNPFLAVRPSTTKNHKSAVCWLRDDVAAELRAVRPAGVSSSAAVWPKGVPDMVTFKTDLAAARIVEKDDRGRRVDFHALRHTLATNLNRAGVAPRIAQEIMRHSELSLTMRTYTDAGALPTRDGVDALPRWQWQQPGPQAGQATGTDGAEVVLQNGTHGNVQRGQIMSAAVHDCGSGKVHKPSEKQGDCPRLSAAVLSGREVRHVGLEPTTR
jgi:integrase